MHHLEDHRLDGLCRSDRRRSTRSREEGRLAEEVARREQVNGASRLNLRPRPKGSRTARRGPSSSRPSPHRAHTAAFVRERMDLRFVPREAATRRRPRVDPVTPWFIAWRLFIRCIRAR